MAAKNAILKAKIENMIYEIMVKTSAEQVTLADTTVAAKIAEMVAAINDRAKHSEVTAEINTVVHEKIGELINGAPETYDTLKEIADYIAAHQDVVTALNEAIGKKADASVVNAIKAITDNLGTLASKNTVTETELASALKTKIDNASAAAHAHSNKSVLDGISETVVSGWNGKAKVYFSATQPSNLTENDLWFDIT